jgi:cytochrome b6-f complex iron-sulfur subunit
MDTTTLFVILVVLAVLLLIAGVLAVAFRRTPTPAGSPDALTGTLDKRAMKADRAASDARQVQAATAVAVADRDTDATETEPTSEPEAAPDIAPAATDTAAYEAPVIDRQVVTAEEYGVTRRKFFNRAILGLFGVAFLGGLTISFLAFLWPKLKGGFGTPISAGKFNDLVTEIIQPDGSLQPVFVAAAQSWIVPFNQVDQPGSSFDGLPVVASEGGDLGLMALWQRCVHLGCRVPSCNSSQGFECPCHGSKYNFHGEYEDGPAPRNLDRFGVEVNAAGELIVLTGAIFETPRSKNKTLAYPQGPSCL